MVLNTGSCWYGPGGEGRLRAIGYLKRDYADFPGKLDALGINVEELGEPDA